MPRIFAGETIRRKAVSDDLKIQAKKADLQAPLLHMKTTRAIYILVGWLCIMVNGIGYVAVAGMPKPYFKDKTIPFIVGFNFWFAAGLVLLLLANRLKRKIRRTIKPEEFD